MQTNEIQKYMDFLLSAAIGKCGELADAQDLTQETLLAALAYLGKGGTLENPKAWLLSVLNRKYYDLLRRKYQLPTVTIEEGFDREDDTTPEETLIRKEEAERVRREVAYLGQAYRDILVMHYFHGKSVKEIAERMDLPESTVKNRLNFGRNQMRKGLETMEKYTENSYQPMTLLISNSGGFGLNEEPMSLVWRDVLAQNILILAYEKPITIPELSKAIGVATAYVEPVVEKLVNGELMKRMGDGKVYTDFIIYHADDWTKYIKDQEAFAEANAQLYFEPLRDAIEALKKTSFYSLPLERFMMIYIAGEGIYQSMENLRRPQIFPDRPNGGKWIAFGTTYPANYEEPKNPGRERYQYAGRRTMGIDSYLDAKDLRIYNYETSLDQNSWKKFQGFGIPSFIDLEHGLLKLFYLIKHGIAPKTVDCNPKIIEAIPILEERGYLTTKNGKPEVLIPCLTHDEESRYFEICNHAKTAFAEQIREPLAKYCETHKKRIPPHLKSVPDQKLTLPYEPNAMVFVYEAIRQGIHPRDLGYPCPETIAVFD